MRQPSNETIEKIFDKVAGRYDRQVGFLEPLMAGGARKCAVSQAHGTVIALAVDTGLSRPLCGHAGHRADERPVLR